MNRGPSFVANAQSPELMQPGASAFYDSPGLAKMIASAADAATVLFAGLSYGKGHLSGRGRMSICQALQSRRTAWLANP